MEGRIKPILLGLLITTSIIYPSNLNNLRVPIHFNWKSAIAYDSNYLKLSDAEINEISLYPPYLGDSESIFSVIAKNSLTIQYKPFLWKKHETKIKLKMSLNNYFASSNKSYSSFGFYIAQHLGKYEWFKFSYSYIPAYYLRDYRDRDNIVINGNINDILEKCYFSQESISLSYSNNLYGIKKSWVEGKINYKTQYYNPFFTEFDLDILFYGLSLYSKFYKNYFLESNISESNASNSTYHNGLISTEKMDRGYSQRNFSISIIKNKIDFTLFQKIGFKYIVAMRKYESDETSDLLHNGRSHIEDKIGLWVSGEINEGVDYKLYFSQRYRITDTDIDWVEELKDFNKYELLFQLSYHFASDILY